MAIVELGLTRLVLGRSAFLPLDQDGYDRTLRAKATVMEVLGNEEKFGLLLDNFLEYERELLSLTLSLSVVEDTSWSGGRDKLQVVNRRLLNVLAAGRMFIDQTRHASSSLLGKDSAEDSDFRSAFSHMYDSRLGYRVMEAMRNFTLHRGLPVQELVHHAWPVDPEERRRWHHSLSLSLILDQVSGEGGFKAGVAKELEALGDTIDVRPLVREYVAALAEIQQRFRGVINDLYFEAVYWIEDLIEKYRKEDGSVLALGVVRREDGRSVERTWLLRDPIERVKALVARHVRTGGIERHFVAHDPGEVNGV